MTSKATQSEIENIKKVIFIFSIAIMQISRNVFKWKLVQKVDPEG